MATKDYTVKFKGEADPSLKRAADEAAGVVDKTTKGIEKAAAKGSALGAGLGTLAGQGIARLGQEAIAFLGDSTRASSDLAEAVNVTELAFGKTAASMDGWFTGSAKRIGMAESAAREFGAGVGGLLQNMGMAENQSAEWSKTLLTLSADMGSAFNTDPADAIQAIGAGLRGESEPLRRYNVMLSDAAIKAKAVEMGLYEGKGAIDNNARAQASLALIMEQTNKIQGDFTNTAEGNANAQRVAAAQVEDLQAKIGVGLLPVQEKLLGVVNDAIPAIMGFGDGLATAAGWIQENEAWLVPLGAGIAVVTAGLWAFNTAQAISTAGGFVKWLGSLSAATSLAAAKQWLLNAAMFANPIGLVVLALVALGVALAVAWNKSETFRTVVTGAWEGIKGAAKSVTDWFTGTAWPAVSGFLDSMRKGFDGFVSGLAAWGNNLRDKVSAPIRWVGQHVLNPLMSGIEKVAGVFGIKWNLPRFSSGGLVGAAPASTRGRMSAYADGGFTGQGGKYEPAGIVHRGEVVWSQDDVAAHGGPWVVEAMRKRRGVPGFAGGGIVPNATQGFRNYHAPFLAAIQAWARATGQTWYMTGNGGARSFSDQLRAWNLYKAGRGPLAANPYGRGGPHQRGVAMDLTPRPGNYPHARALLGQFGLGLTVKGEPWHVGWLGGGGTSGGAGFDPLGAIKAAIGTIAKVPGAGMLGELLNSVPSKLISGAADAVKRRLGFDEGGWLLPGGTHAVNKTGRPEAVLTGDQWASVRESVRRSGEDREQLAELVEVLWALVRATMTRDEFESIVRTLSRRDAPRVLEAI